MNQRVCRSCNVAKDDDAFYVSNPTKCKECVKSAVKTNYAAKRREKSAYERERAQRPKRRLDVQRFQEARRRKSPEKYKARTAVGNALRDGRLIRGKCRCGSLRVQAHHHDYSKPLDVTWLCFKCHREDEHGQVVTDDVAPVAAE